MLKHENPHIEILNENLWAVRYSLIPLIPQINMVHKDGTEALPMDELIKLPCQYGPDGIMLLNKDFRWYDTVRKTMLDVMKMPMWKIKKEISRFGRRKADTPQKIIYQYCLQAETERRKIKKGGVT